MEREKLFNGNDNNRSLNEIREMKRQIESDMHFARECIRHRISALLADYGEENPLEVECTFGDEDACGLSSLQMPRITKAFQSIPDGTIWFVVEGCDEPCEMDEAYLEGYGMNGMFSLNDLIEIADAIEWEVLGQAKR